LIGEFDYLFINEAGQVSVAKLIGISQVTNNIILMGDQMQLGQLISDVIY
jgi:superfamily I DNA and/or RNA helicase